MSAFLFVHISRASIYRYMADGTIKAVQFKGKTLIRRKDIDALFENTASYNKRLPKERTAIIEFYTTAEVKEKYNVKDSWIFVVAKKHNIPRTFNRGKTYWSKKHIDNYFAQKAADPEITEWYSVAVIQEKFGMTLASIYGLTSNNTIPKNEMEREFNNDMLNKAEAISLFSCLTGLRISNILNFKWEDFEIAPDKLPPGPTYTRYPR